MFIFVGNLNIKIMTTPADEKRNLAKDHLDKAYKCLLEAIDPETSGSGEFSREYLAILEESLLKLIRMKRDL